MLQKIWTDVWSKLLTSVILVAVTAVGAYLTGLWPHVATIAAKIPALVGASTLVPNWLLVPICLLATLGVLRLLVTLYRYIAPLDWRTYRQDTFFGIVWRWGYVGNGLTIPQAFCPRCDTRMDVKPDPSCRYPRWRTFYDCGHCDYRIVLDGTEDAVCHKVLLEIERKVRQMGR